MAEFLSAAIGFPAVLFGAALVVIVCFWLLVLAGAAEHDSFDTDLDAEAVGFGGVPVTVSVSLFVVIAWFASLAGSVAVHSSGLTGGPRAGLMAAVLAGALLVAWVVVHLLVQRFRRHFPAQAPPSRQDFIGLVCTVRTGSVTADFGQAEVAAADGSTAIVQVRQLPSRGARDTGEPLAAGCAGLLYAYDDEGEFFWVAPYDSALDPGAGARALSVPRPVPRKAA